MGSGITGACLILAGALCALGGYCMGAWRQRLQFRLELDAEDVDSHERVLEMIESLADRDDTRTPAGRKDDRLN